MDIDVKNALEKLLFTCNDITSEDRHSFNEIFVRDIYSFINSISRQNCNARFNYLSKVYLGGEYKAEDFAKAQLNNVPKSLEILCNTDRKVRKDIKLSKLLVAFFITLGRHYMTSTFDRNDIDSSRVMDLIKTMNEYIDVRNQEQTNIRKDGVCQRRTKTATNSNESREEICVNDADNKESESEDTEESLEELLEKLNSLIGLEDVKKEVEGIINMIKVKKKGEELGVKQPPLSLHLVFYGNPGTGKTTVARLLAKIYKSLGVLSGGQLVEVDRGGLVAGYIGQTAIKTQEVIDRAMGGILFIDEAYSLTHRKGETDFGQEAIDTILKAMEDHRDDFIVIVAGYPDLMEEFILSNPGLKSRFNKYINFTDYRPDELYEIFCMFCREQELRFDDDCVEYLKSYFENLYDNRKEDFANGRDVRNYFENVIRAWSNRLANSGMDGITREEYLTIVKSDLEDATGSTNSL